MNTLICASSYVAPKDLQMGFYSKGLQQEFGAKMCPNTATLKAWGTLCCRMLLHLLELLYLLHHFSHLRAVSYCWTNFWTYAWKIHKMCDRTLIAERNVYDEIRCRDRGILVYFSRFRLRINNAGFFHIFPEIFSDIFKWKVTSLKGYVLFKRAL